MRVPYTTLQTQEVNTIQLNTITLCFNRSMKDLEKPYRYNFIKQRFKLIQFSILAGTILYAIFGFLDGVVMPEQKHTAWVIRMACICQSALSLFLISFSHRIRAHTQFVSFLFILCAGLGIILLSMIAPPPFSYYYYAGLILVLIFVHSNLCLRFVWAFQVGWLIVIMYNAGAYLSHLPMQEMISNNFFLISANILGSIMGYFTEFISRKHFYLTHLLDKKQSELVEMSRAAGMAEVATGVLHNVGNVLNSVNVSSNLLADQLMQSRTVKIGKLADLLQQHQGDLSEFLISDPRGRQVPGYLISLAPILEEERQFLLKETHALRDRIDHIKEIVSMQQSYGRVSGVHETIPTEILMEDALRLNAGALARHGITIRRDYQSLPPISTDKHQVLQILLNLINNAKLAYDGIDREKIITLRIFPSGPDRLSMQVSDNGAGILPENLTRIFQHGFTTRKTGHGFGLHSGAIAAIGLGGCLTGHSEGPGLGATFTLELPFHSGGKA